MASERTPITIKIGKYLLGWLLLPVFVCVSSVEFWQEAWILLKDAVHGDLI